MVILFTIITLLKLCKSVHKKCYVTVKNFIKKEKEGVECYDGLNWLGNCIIYRGHSTFALNVEENFLLQNNLRK